MHKFDLLADRSKDHSKKWCRNVVEKRFGKIPEDYISMWIADMDYELAEPVYEKFKEVVERRTLGYIYCYEDFYKAIISWYSEKVEYVISPEEIQLNYGIVSGLYNVIQTFCKENVDCVVVNNPVYNPFREAAYKNGVEVIENNLYVKDNRYHIDFDDLERKFKRYSPKLYILCTPQNPGGRIWSKEELIQIAELCYEYNVILVADEAHSDHIYQGEFFSTLDLKEPFKNNLILLNSANKAFNIAGLKSSYSIIPSVELRTKFKKQLDRNHVDEPNVFGIAGIVSAYTDEGKKWVEDSYTYICENYEYAKKEIENNCDKVKIMDMEASYLMWLDVSALGLNGDEFTMRLARDTGVLFQEGSSFGSAGLNWVRINLATSHENTKDAIHRMLDWIAKWESSNKSTMQHIELSSKGGSPNSHIQMK